MQPAMTVPLKTVEVDTAAIMPEIGRRARDAARLLALVPTEQKDKALAAIAQAIRDRKDGILAANADDVASAKAAGANSAFLDRLSLDGRRVAAMADGIDVVRALADPVGKVTESWTRPNGMTIERVRVPLGVMASFTRAARTSPPTPPRCASKPAMPRSCAAARRASDPTWRSAMRSRMGSRWRGCRKPRSSSFPPAIAPPWG
jgi:hypothetical protein